MIPRSTFLVVLVLLVALALPAIEVSIVSPSPDELLLGMIEVEVVVISEHPIDRVELWLDGQRLMQLEVPPFRFSIDVGDELVSHRLEVVAADSSGARASAELRSLEIHATSDSLELGLQQVYLTVSRDRGERVLDLSEDELTLLDNGVAQRIVSFGRGNIPFTAVLLIDASQTPAGYWQWTTTSLYWKGSGRMGVPW
jgi:hypothetical protein